MSATFGTRVAEERKLTRGPSRRRDRTPPRGHERQQPADKRLTPIARKGSISVLCRVLERIYPPQAEPGGRSSRPLVRVRGAAAFSARPRPVAARRSPGRRAPVPGAALSAGWMVLLSHAPYLLNLAATTASPRALGRSPGRGAAASRAARSSEWCSTRLRGEGDRASAKARCRAAVSEAVAHPGTARRCCCSKASRLRRSARPHADGARASGRTRAAFLAQWSRGPRVGVCLDSAHLWGAGYDLLGDGWERVLGELADAWQLEAHSCSTATTPRWSSARTETATRPRRRQAGQELLPQAPHRPALRRTPDRARDPAGRWNVLIKKALARLRRWAR